MESPATPSRTSLASALGWGFFLACSWTWVIGMFLPVLLVRDYGWGGWLVFAVPNVIGAGAMGFVLSRQTQAEQIIRHHHTAVGLFSAVTVSFQIYVLLWLMPRLVGRAGLFLLLGALLATALWPLVRLLANRVAAVAVWAMSAGLALFLWFANVLEVPPATGQAPPWHLAGLASACLLGFALCPYLDATFLLTRTRTDRQGARVAFGVGFGVLFLAMILFTLLYARPLWTGIFEGAAAWLLAIHLTLQVSFTVAVHVWSLRQLEVQTDPTAPPTADTTAPGPSAAMLAGLLIAAVLGMAALQAETAEIRLAELSLGEQFYRGYMGFYGLLFPAYVLLVMWRGTSFRAFWITCAVAMAFFVLGFLLRWMPWTLAGVGIVLAAGLLIPPRRAWAP